MATYRCLQSNQEVTFTNQFDIDGMKGHQGYVRIDEEKTIDKPLTLSEPKKIGRPRKAKNV
jgi:hypothetical protein